MVSSNITINWPPCLTLTLISLMYLPPINDIPSSYLCPYYFMFLTCLICINACMCTCLFYTKRIYELIVKIISRQIDKENMVSAALQLRLMIIFC